MKAISLALPVAVMVMGLTACTTPVSQSLTGGGHVTVAYAPGNMAVASREAGTKSIAIRLPEAYALQAVVHRWVASDVFEYRVVLRRKQGEQFVDFTPPLVVSCPQKNGAPVKQAVFTELKQGEVYQAELEAWGNVGGSSAEKRLNNEVRSLATFDFSASNDVEDTLAADLKIVFDKVPFSGTVSIGILPPDEADYATPSSDPGSSEVEGTAPSLPAESPEPADGTTDEGL